MNLNSDSNESRRPAAPARRLVALVAAWACVVAATAGGCRSSKSTSSAPRIPEPIADPFLGPSRITPPPLYVPPGGGVGSTPAPAASSAAPPSGASSGGSSGSGVVPLPAAPPTSIPSGPPSAPPSYPSTTPGGAPLDGRPLPGPASEPSADRLRNGAAVPSARSASPGAYYDEPGDRGAPASPAPPARKPDPPAREAEREPPAVRRTAAWVESPSGGSKFWTPRREDSATLPEPNR